MRALVTGATGFVGRHLVSALALRGWEIVCLVHRSVSSRIPHITCHVENLDEPDTLAIKGSRIGPIDVIFHLAAALPHRHPPPNLLEYSKTNALATMRLLELALEWRIRTFVYASSLAVIGIPDALPVTEDHPTRPSHPYLLSKLFGELACEMSRRTTGLAVTSLRITSPYGPGMAHSTVLPQFVSSALQSNDLLWFGSGERTQNFVHVDDVVEACLLAASAQHFGIYNIAGPRSISMRDLAALTIRLSKDSQSNARPADKPDPQDHCRWEVDLTHARTHLGFSPTIHLEDGLAAYIEAVRCNSRPLYWWEETPR